MFRRASEHSFVPINLDFGVREFQYEDEGSGKENTHKLRNVPNRGRRLKIKDTEQIITAKPINWPQDDPVVFICLRKKSIWRNLRL